MPAIHIFNPESDYALASFSPTYTAPASVLSLRKRMAFLPARYAAAGDIILTPDPLPTPENFPSKLLHATLPGLRTMIASGNLPDDLQIIPWGWNPALRRMLADAGVPAGLLPDDDWLENLRGISHRRITRDFLSLSNNLCSSSGLSNAVSPLPQEFKSVREAIEWEHSHHPAFFKMPWSSSGRGILMTEDLDTEKHLLPWLTGVIQRQGSVMGEQTFPKSLDFATEWLITDDGHGNPMARFIGYSAFEASRRGKYHFNIGGSQEKIFCHIEEALGIHNDCNGLTDASAGKSLTPRSEIPSPGSLIDIQSQCLEKLCGTYRGYCGIDMLGAADGRIHPCIEINWRLTMGIVEILKLHSDSPEMPV